MWFWSSIKQSHVSRLPQLSGGKGLTKCLDVNFGSDAWKMPGPFSASGLIGLAMFQNSGCEDGVGSLAPRVVEFLLNPIPMTSRTEFCD